MRVFLGFFTIITIHLFSCGRLYWGGHPTRLEVKANFLVNQGNLDRFVVTIRQDTSTIKIIRNKSNFALWLDYNHKYYITLSKPGYITKTVEFLTTNLSAQSWNKGFEPYSMQLTIHPQSTENPIEYTQPVCTIYYDPSIDDFNFKTNYTKLEKLNKKN